MGCFKGFLMKREQVSGGREFYSRPPYGLYFVVKTILWLFCSLFDNFRCSGANECAPFPKITKYPQIFLSNLLFLLTLGSYINFSKEPFTGDFAQSKGVVQKFKLKGFMETKHKGT